MGAYQNSITAERSFWFSSHERTLERTAETWSPFFRMTYLQLPETLQRASVEPPSPGKLIVLELSEADASPPSTASIESWNQNVADVIRFFDKPVTVCIGNLIPAQVAVHWIHRGVFTYLESHATLEQFRQTFVECHKRVTHIAEQYRRFDVLLERWKSVTEREAIVLEMLLDGTTNKSIARRLGVSQRTVEARRQVLYGKLNAKCIAEVVKVMYELENLAQVFHRIDHGTREATPHPNFPVRGIRPLPVISRDTRPTFLPASEN